MRIYTALFAAVACLIVPVYAQHFTAPPQAAGAAAPTDTATGTVYFYRLRKAYAALLKPEVDQDGKQILRMRNGRFIKMSIPSGSHTFISNFKGNGLVLDVKPGETYYIRMEITPASFVHTAKGEIFVAEPGQGKFEIAQLQPAEPEDTKNGAGTTDEKGK